MVHRLKTGTYLLKPQTEDGLYSSVHHCVDIGDEIPPSLPLQKGVPRFAEFGKEGPFDRAHGHELVERLEEVFGRPCLLNYGLLGI